MSKYLSPRDIRRLLPHRGRMLLLEDAEIDQEGSLGRAILRIGPSWCTGMCCPHLYVAEALAQLAGVTIAAIAANEPSRGALGFLVEFSELRFGEGPEPGDEIELEAREEMAFGALVRFGVSARRGEHEIVAGSLSIAIGGGEATSAGAPHPS